MPKTILVVVDSPASGMDRAVERAAWLAERVDADLELFACEFDADIDAGRVASVLIPEPGTRDRLLALRRRALETLAAPLLERGLRVKVTVAWDYPLAEAVVKKAATDQPWLVARDTEHHNVAQRTLLTNTDWHLIRYCPGPLLLVKARPLAAAPTVLAAVDPLHQHAKPTHLDDAIVRFATTLAERTGGNLHVVHAFAQPMGLTLPPDVEALVARQHRDALNTFVAGLGVPSANVHLVKGFAREALPQAATDVGADFVVMGAVARRGLGRIFIGSTAERALDRLPCDLVIVKPAGFLPPGDDRN